jgi:biopolymer transport protein ExbD
MKLGQLSEQMTPSGADEPNITPLIDIVFILLIFFVVTTTFAQELGIEIERPEAQSGSEVPTRIVRIAVTDHGDVTVDARATSPWRIEHEVRERLSLYAEKAVLVVADRRVDAAQLVEVIDAARRGGATDVALAVEEASP